MSHKKKNPWTLSFGKIDIPIENLKIDIEHDKLPTHPNCKTSIGHHRMGTYDDLIKRHKKVTDMRKKAAQSKSGRVSAFDPYGVTISANQPTTISSGSGLDQAMKDLAKMMSAPPTWNIDPVTGSPTTKKAPAKKAPPKPTKKTVEFDSVVLEQEKKTAVLEALDQLDKHELIFEKWGFGKTLEKGKAVSMLFYGPPGTGKTLLAQAIADKLDKKLKIIGTAEIESSEPGAAERNIKAFFEQTKKDTVLLFDECDSLIYDRQHVGSILAAQVNQLLGSLEKFEGVVIFTTNRLGVLDEAFNRRLSLKLEFEMPSFKDRIKIWKRMFPKEAPLAKDVDWEVLAGPEISGGHIKNAVLRAARTAASTKVKKGQRKKITQAILTKALTAEIKEMVKFIDARDKQGRLPSQVGYTIRKG